ncbi:histidine phosphatase family protein [Pseudomonas typographi]|uniref:histidine phosphatase family protein n=1 Tax=Pseudomonas typographi TaxID=2715964 RepID=UPI001684C858|nr:histidine phosphatase family protein [Pseudomonas typographi]
MTLRLSLLRHGVTTRGGGFRGSLDDGLTAAGWAQMRAALAGRGGWARVVSSPLQRCVRFAETLSLPLLIEPALRELHFGEWEGCSAAQVHERDPQALARFWANPYGATPPGGEPVAAFAERVWRAVDGLAVAYPGEALLVVTHGGVIRLLLAAARRMAPERLLEVSVGHGELFTLEGEPGAWQEVEPCGRC